MILVQAAPATKHRSIVLSEHKLFLSNCKSDVYFELAGLNLTSFTDGAVPNAHL